MSMSIYIHVDIHHIQVIDFHTFGEFVAHSERNTLKHKFI